MLYVDDGEDRDGGGEDETQAPGQHDPTQHSSLTLLKQKPFVCEFLDKSFADFQCMKNI